LISLPTITTGTALTAASGMFAGCASLKIIPTFTTTNVTNFISMFSGCYSLTAIPTLTTTAATSMNGTFYGCGLIRAFPAMNTSNVTDFSNMFANCYALTTVPALDTSKATTMAGMFTSCYSLKYVPPLSGRSITVAMTTTSHVFNAAKSCESFVLTGIKNSLTIGAMVLSPTALNAFYSGMADNNAYTVTGVVGNGTTATYTVSGTCRIVVGQNVTVTGISPAGYNVTNAVVTASNSTSFTVANATVTTYASGGAIAALAGQIVTVTGNWGVASDDTTIATNKGWTVTG
jgi:surface protein